VSDPIVSLVAVTRRYGSTTAVNALSLAVGRGELVGLIGPDGAGKTTTIRLIAGLIAPDEGTLCVAGHHPRREHRALARHVGYLSQRFSLYGDLSIDENVAFFAEIHGVRDYASRRDRLLDLTGLAPFRTRLADRLSGGMKQKLALVCTLVHEPRLLLLDEPTTGVDPVARRELWVLLSEILEQGLTIVMATPYLDEAERCHRVAFLHEGRLLAFDRPGTLRTSFEGEVVEILGRPPGRIGQALDAWPEFADHQMFGERTHVRLRGTTADAALPALRGALAGAGIAVESVRSVVPSLEDVFIDRLSAGTPQGDPP
jgi:ABC-2 type transport system ATP-binding protein